MSEQRPQGNTTYRELGRLHFRSPEYRAWEDWLIQCGFPIHQIPMDGAWVARDEIRRTVSAKVMLWRPDDEISFAERDGQTLARRDASLTDCQYGVHTIKLDDVPPPFPEPIGTREEREEDARGELAALRRKLVDVGELTRDDEVKVEPLRDAVEALSRMLDSVLSQRRPRDSRGARVGSAWARGVVEQAQSALRRL